MGSRDKGWWARLLDRLTGARASPPARSEVADHEPELPGDVPQEPVDLAIDGELDLHTFSPREVPELLPEYIGECQRRGILQLRVVHGKGTGTLRRTVHALLERDPRVRGYRLAGPRAGAWGATQVDLHPAEPDQ